MFEFSQLRCFAAVAEELHFGKAARRLNMTQPPLSRQVQLLEHELGVQLLVRSSRSVQLTPAGRAFLPEARQMLRLAQDAAWSAKRAARGEVGAVTLGFTAGSSYAVLPRLIALAMREMPDVALVLREMKSTEQIEALATRTQDAGLIRLPADLRGAERACVARERMILAVPEGHALASGSSPSLTDLDRLPFVMYSPTDARYFFDLTFSLFRAAEVMPNVVQHVSQIHTVLSLVSAGMGAALVPEAARSLHVQGIALRDLHPAPVAHAELHLMWLRENDNPAFKLFRTRVLAPVIESLTSSEGGYP